MYKLGTIYKIIDTMSDLCYVGMTFGNLANRMQQHKIRHDKEGKDCAIYPFMREFGVDRFKIIRIKDYEVVDRQHLAMYETLWINKLTCVNKNVSFNAIPKKHYRNMLYEKNKTTILAQQKRYYEANTEKIAERSKAYVEANKEKTAEYQKKYREENLHRINEQKREYRRVNDEKIKARKVEKVQCPCGATVSRNNNSEHKKSAKHQRFLETQQQA